MNKYFLIFSCFILSCSTLIKVPAPSLIWPLKKIKISQHYAPLSNHTHQGLDLVSPLGTPVLSSHGGTVVYAGSRLSFYGKTVVVEYSAYWSTLYAHLHEIKVKAGDKISQGHVIGTVGKTGRANGVHLHFELSYKSQPINPLIYLK